MKKKFIPSITLAILMSAVLSCGVYAAVVASNEYIGEAKAKSIALENAGVNEDQATFIKTHLDRDDGFVVYDIEFYVENTEYDYEIDAITGDIVEYDYETDHRAAKAAVKPAAKTNVYVGEEKAKAIALADAGLNESQVRKMDIDLDREHGVMIYEVEFEYEYMEYEYEINAADGTLLKSNVEYDD